MAQVNLQEMLVRGYAGQISFVLAFGWLTILKGHHKNSPLLPTISGTLGLPPV